LAALLETNKPLPATVGELKAKVNKYAAPSPSEGGRVINHAYGAYIRRTQSYRDGPRGQWNESTGQIVCIGKLYPKVLARYYLLRDKELFKTERVYKPG
jgi:hypothetical protein